MTAPERGLIDTSVWIAREAGRPLRRELLPRQSAVSVITWAELRAGVLSAAGTDALSARLRTMEEVEDTTALDIDVAVADVWADMRAHMAEVGRRVNVNDLWIAATAAAHAIPIVTQDTDFDPLEGVAGLAVIRV